MTGRAITNLDNYMNGTDTTNGGGAFINVVKTYSIFTPMPGVVDAFGYPIAPNTGAGGSIATLPQFRGPNDQWVVKCTGTRQFKILLDTPVTQVGSPTGLLSSVVSGAQYTCTFSGAGRAVFKFNTVSNSFTLYFYSGGTSVAGTGDLVICRLSDEAALDAGEIITPEFDAYMKDVNPLAVRFMPWDVASDNYQNSVKWAYRTTPGHLSWVASTFPPGAWGGNTSGTNTYAGSAAPDSPATLTHLEVWQGQLTNAPTTEPVTFDIGTRGTPKPIVGASGGSIVGPIGTGPVTLVYHDALGKWICRSGGFNSTTPVEVAINLAKRWNCGLWRTIPFLAEDAWATGEATAIADPTTGLTSSLQALFEYHNEVWNFTFPATGMIYNIGLGLGFTASSDRNQHGWYGLRFRQLMGIITPLFASRGNLIRVMAFQGFGDTNNISTYRWLGSDLDTSKGFTKYNSFVGVSYNTVGQRPIDWADAISYATYYLGANFQQFDANYTSAMAGVLQTAANNYASGAPANINAAIAWLTNDIRQGLIGGTGALGAETMKGINDNIMPAWNALAVTYNKSVYCYEGAMAIAAPSAAKCTSIGCLVPPTTGTGAAAAAALAGLAELFKNRTECALVWQDQVRQFMSFSKSVAPPQFVLWGPGQWNTMQGGMFSTPYKHHEALKLFNSKKRRMIVRT